MHSAWRLRGLTLGEIVIATSLVSLLIVVTLQLLTRLLVSSTKNRAALAAVNFATLRLEEIAENNLVEAAFTTQHAYLTDGVSETEYFLEVRRDPVAGQPDEAVGAYLGGYSFTATCYWNVDTPQRIRPGAGLQKVAVTRFFYPRLIVP